MKITAKHQTALKMKGDLVLTDPCYFFKGELEDKGLWADFCKIMFPGGNPCELTDEGVATIETPRGPVQFIYMSTAHGDGFFKARGSRLEITGEGIGVDAGMISCILVSDLLKIIPRNEIAGLGQIVKDFDGEVEVFGADREGKMEGYSSNGSFVIETGYEEEEDEDGWDDEEEEF